MITLTKLYGNPTDTEMAAFEDACYADWLEKVEAIVASYDANTGPDVNLREVYDDGASATEGARILLGIDW